MIYKDQNNFPLDETMDGGDSSVRAGILAMTDHPLAHAIDFFKYEIAPGEFTRHPTQVPWNNPKNWSRDQSLPFLAGLHAKGIIKPMERYFYKRMKAFFFAQNIERDYPGTTKRLYPHAVDNETRLFDYADPLMPNHIGAMIKGAKLYRFYWFLPLSYAFHYAALFFNRKATREQNQLIAESYLLGTKKHFKKICPKWVDASKKYWYDRNEREYHDSLVEWMKND